MSYIIVSTADHSTDDRHMITIKYHFHERRRPENENFNEKLKIQFLDSLHHAYVRKWKQHI